VVDTESAGNQAAIERAAELRQEFLGNINEGEGILD